MSIYVFYFFLYFSSMFVFVSKRKHLLLMLLSLESSMVALYLGLFTLLSKMDFEYFFSMVFLTISVCESALSLSVLVLMIRTHSNDYILSFDSLW
uniref:NADH-ubiquinone oxidoreductase chain 4L n=1 Tax=Aegorhinus superciliosus TaxID=1448030 RepID=A0A0K0K9I3_9CUCU|nr:NADH dehydrogenase subunit 4L [Aegorhinus superciliosus]AHG32673.1 NADH dehydrogenase subunit 4L [Aegorhinus superciliosus]